MLNFSIRHSQMLLAGIQPMFGLAPPDKYIPGGQISREISSRFVSAPQLAVGEFSFL
jgi:hypothetical protein